MGAAKAEAVKSKDDDEVKTLPGLHKIVTLDIWKHIIDVSGLLSISVLWS